MARRTKEEIVAEVVELSCLLRHARQILNDMPPKTRDNLCEFMAVNPFAALDDINDTLDYWLKGVEARRLY